MNLLPFTVIWSILAAGLIVLLLYRRSITSEEDDTLHVGDPTGAITARQAEIARKLEALDRWVKVLTIILIVFGVALGAGYLYNAWIQTSSYAG